MRLHLQTEVQQHFLAVFNAFDEKLFLKLAPPYPRLKLLRFDGSLPGDIIEVELHTGLTRYRWASLITEQSTTNAEAYFIDEGQVLPPPLSKWYHKHLVTRKGDGAIIHDIIEYSTGNSMLEMLLYPLIVGQFSMRKPIYRREFN